MQQRQRVGEALGRAARNVESHVFRCLGQEIVEMRPAEPGRHVSLLDVVERAKPFFQPQRAPEAPPERDPSIARRHRLGSKLVEPPDHLRQLRPRHAELGEKPVSHGPADVRPRFDQIKTAIATDQLVERQIVVHVGEVHVHDLEAQKREGLERVQSVHGEDAHDRRVRADRGQRTLERRLGAVAEQETQPRVVAGAAGFVERLEPIQPGRRARTRSGADLQREDFGGQLAAGIEIAQQRPEVGHRVGDRLRMIGVRLDARRRDLEAVARRRLPGLEPFPEQMIEPPDDALAKRSEVLQAHAIVQRGLEIGIDRLEGAGQLLRHQCRIGLAEVDGNLGERERTAVRVGGAPNGDRIAEIVLVVDPVQVHA